MNINRRRFFGVGAAGLLLAGNKVIAKSNHLYTVTQDLTPIYYDPNKVPPSTPLPAHCGLNDLRPGVCMEYVLQKKRFFDRQGEDNPERWLLEVTFDNGRKYRTFYDKDAEHGPIWSWRCHPYECNPVLPLVTMETEYAAVEYYAILFMHPEFCNHSDSHGEKQIKNGRCLICKKGNLTMNFEEEQDFVVLSDGTKLIVAEMCYATYYPDEGVEVCTKDGETRIWTGEDAIAVKALINRNTKKPEDITPDDLAHIKFEGFKNLGELTRWFQKNASDPDDN